MEYENGSPGSSRCVYLDWYAFSQAPTGTLSMGALPMKRMLVQGLTFESVRWTSRVVPIPPTTNPEMTSALTQRLRDARTTVPENAAPPRAISRQNATL